MGPLWSLCPGGRMCFLVVSLSSHPWACSVPWLSAAYNFLNYLSRPWVLPVACCWLWGSEAGGGGSECGTSDRAGETWGRIGIGHPSFYPCVLYESQEDRDLLPPRPLMYFLCPFGGWRHAPEASHGVSGSPPTCHS